jgi:hypothetical protein
LGNGYAPLFTGPFRSGSALSSDAREAGLPFGQKRMNGIFYLVGLIVVVLLVTYALGLW